ncbi:hypothetical protein BGZ51_004868 [Haplosporangium sp. Z 767]|nr:hypothetical protein BGZ50_006708 [Haplosporangium sp. Z 11]KAF9182222.1 hypothetical protein BGZ51_004868 [Haplosporangium sp. Z 767]
MVISSRKSVGYWFDTANEQDQLDYVAITTSSPFLRHSVVSSRDGSTGAAGTTISNPFLDSSSVIQTLYGTENFEILPIGNQNTLLSRLDTPQMHFLQIIQELDGAVFVQERLESMRNNPAYSRFFKPEPALPGSSKLHADINNVSDECPEDKGYHLPRPPNIPHIVYITRIGRGPNSQRREFRVDQVPSGSSYYTKISRMDGRQSKRNKILSYLQQ